MMIRRLSFYLRSAMLEHQGLVPVSFPHNL